MHHFILLNGPPKCGKDTVVKQLIPYLKFTHMKFADPLKDRLCCVLNCSRRELEEIKDIPHKLLRKKDSLECYTPREELIYDSEHHWKPRYGEDIFGRILAHRSRGISNKLVIASDCGFDCEVERIIAEYGRHNARVVRIHRDNCDFKTDSRSYLRSISCQSYDLSNNGTRHDITMAVLRIITREFPEYRSRLLREPDWIK